MPEMPISAARYVAMICGHWPHAEGDPQAAFYTDVSALTSEDSNALFMAAICRHGKDGRVGDPSRAQQSTALEDRLAEMINPSITDENALKQCCDLGSRLAEFLTQGSEVTIEPSQVIFLSSPVERALQTTEQVIKGFLDYYHRTYGGSAASELDQTIHVLPQLREYLEGHTRDWHDTKTAIVAKHPNADVTRMIAESDPAQSVDLRLVPEDGDRSEEPIPVPGQKNCFTTAKARFLNRPRGVLESLRRVDELDEQDRDEATKNLRPDQFDERLVSLGSLMVDIAQTHRLETGLQPVFVASSHFQTVNAFLDMTHEGASANIPSVMFNAECVLSTYDESEPLPTSRPE